MPKQLSTTFLLKACKFSFEIGFALDSVWIGGGARCLDASLNLPVEALRLTASLNLSSHNFLAIFCPF
jgi:hypothetical protein